MHFFLLSLIKPVDYQNIVFPNSICVNLKKEKRKIIGHKLAFKVYLKKLLLKFENETFVGNEAFS